MEDGVLQFTLRRLQGLVFAPRFWAVMLTAAIVLGLAGPFGTLERMPLLPRLGYWLAIALSTFLAGYVAIGLMLRYILGDIGVRPVRVALAGLTAGAPVTAIVLLLNYALLGDPPGSPEHILSFYLTCSVIAAAISFLFGLAEIQPQTEPAAAAPADAATERPAILDRIPHHLRGRLLYMSMQDHYVDVHTDRGNALVLMRLADAIAEARDADGMQIHRSHWIASDAVAGAERKDGRLFLRLRDGALLPVSRSCLAAVRKAGLA